jgi:hypothetical protein
MPIRLLSLISRTQSLQYDLPQIFSIIVLAGDECVQPARQTVNWGIVRGVFIVWEDLYGSKSVPCQLNVGKEASGYLGSFGLLVGQAGC